MRNTGEWKPETREIVCVICRKQVTAIVGGASERNGVCGMFCLVALQNGLGVI